jgi:hypothetical protein
MITFSKAKATKMVFEKKYNTIELRKFIFIRYYKLSNKAAPNYNTEDFN